MRGPLRGTLPLSGSPLPRPPGLTAAPHAGTIDIERALRDGVKAFEPGLLARANRGILYVDEVNLLEDNLVDVVLDSAAGGVNTVEREGVSIIHPAKFIMIGSGALRCALCAARSLCCACSMLCALCAMCALRCALRAVRALCCAHKALADPRLPFWPA